MAGAYKSNESLENYLETILVLSRKLPVVRSVDIANELNFKKPSVSVAMKNLRINGYINMDHSGFITLTDAGKEVAERIYERHLLLTKGLKYLGVDDEIAAKDACKIEHDLSPESFEALKKYIEETLDK